MTQVARMRIMGAALAILALCILFGCSVNEYAPVSQYECTVPQMQKAEAETRFCSKEVDFTTTWCYAAAISRNCQPKQEAATSALIGLTKQRADGGI